MGFYFPTCRSLGAPGNSIKVTPLTWTLLQRDCGCRQQGGFGTRVQHMLLQSSEALPPLLTRWRYATKKPEGGKGCQVVLIYKILQKAGRWSHPIIFRGLIYPDFAASCSSGISWCITYPAPLHTSKDPSPCTPSSSELLPMPPFSAWFSVCPDMPQLVRSTSFQKATDLVFEKQCLDSLSARPTWHSSKANFAFSACSVKSSPRQRATGTMIFPPSPPQLVDKAVLHCAWLASDFKDE